jgi:phosphate transport system permease protein
LMLSGVGDNVYVVWQNGRLTRISTQDIETPKIVEEVELLGDPALSITAIQFLIGKGSMLVGDSSGRIRVWFRTKPAGATAPDGNKLVPGHEFPGTGAAVTSLVSSQRTRLMAAGYADGRAKVFYVTSEKQLADIDAGNGQEVRGLALTPKEDGLLAVTPHGIAQWNMDVRHPETTLTSIFRPVWYEGYEKPTQVWQSSGGSDEVEPKFGLWPLVFGTLKAAFYSLLIGVPLALLAAIYTSEFLHPRAKNIVKPTIELMASLPSVVLGFLAALVFAPFVEKHLSIALAGFFTIPGALLVGAYVWQFLPDKVNLRLSRQRFVFFGLALLAGIGAATIAGPIMERTLFAGDLKGWLAGRHGSGTSGWLMILFPLFAVGTAIASGRVVTPYIRRMSIGWTRLRCAFVDVIKFAAGLALSLAGAWIAGLILNSLGFDPRGSVVGTYVQRNALVVGFVMGFAVIPIVYTLAEDALSAVPEHLRAASLGCGATPWQTASRVIVPSAMSGLFSAVMIGMGRAVGETMIVLMAAGNTPVMEMNIFNGFRTLSANIAVEMPEAVVNSTHYRTLFLAALLLFGFTFVVNTLAEGVRQRFRKRAYQL